MKAVATTAGALALLALAGSAQAIDGGIEAGREYTNLHAGLGTRTPGFALSGNWLRSDHDGSMGSLGLGYNVAVGEVLLSPGIKAIATHPRDSKDGYAVAAGAGVSVPLTSMFNVYGQYYYSPDALSSHIDNYQEASAGVSFKPVSLVDVHVGYQYMALNGKNGRKDNVIADGPYVGASLHF